MNRLNNRLDLAKIQNIFQQMNARRFSDAEISLGYLALEYPNNSSVCATLSELYYRQGKIRQAKHYALKAYEHFSLDYLLDEILYISKMLSACGRDDLAIEVVKQIYSKVSAPSDIQNLALHYFKLDCQEASIELFKKVPLELLTDYAIAMYGISLLYAGHIEQATAHFNKIIDLGRGSGIVYHQLSMLDASEGREDRISSMLDKIRSEMSIQEKSSYCFALFHEYNHLNQSSEAFKFLSMANELRVKLNAHDSSQESSLTNLYISKLEKINFDQPSINFASNEVSPIFILGLPRAGTTLLESLISKMDDILPVGEHLSFLQSIDEVIGNVISKPIDIAKYNIDEIDFEELGRIYLDKIKWRSNGHLFVTDKTPVNYVFTGIILKALPEARVIHISKNPMDSCFSIYKQAFANDSYTASYSIEDIIVHYKNYSKIMHFWRNALGERLLEVKYEDLILRNELCLEKINKFCKFNNKNIQQTEHVIRASTLSASQIHKPIHSRNINAWARYSEFLKPLRHALDEEYVAYMSSVEGAEIL